jgi:hypothetical protein
MITEHIDTSASLAYAPLRFTDLANTKLGRALWLFLNERDNLLRMETASELRRPAVEAVATRLLATFGDEVRGDRVKRMIGHMTKQVMKHQGFELDSQNVRVRTGELFVRGTRYIRSLPREGS